MGEGEAVPSVQAGAEDERCCAEEAVAAAEAALGTGKNEAEEGGVGQAVAGNSEENVKPAEPAKTLQRQHAEAVQHITEAHQILSKLRQELDKHPAVEQAIQKLEMALAMLSVKTGGFL